MPGGQQDEMPICYHNRFDVGWRGFSPSERRRRIAAVVNGAPTARQYSQDRRRSMEHLPGAARIPRHHGTLAVIRAA